MSPKEKNVTSSHLAVVEAGWLSPEEMAEAVRTSEAAGRSLADALSDLGVGDEASLLSLWSERLGLPVHAFNGHAPSGEALEALPVGLAQRHKCVPVHVSRGRITLAFSEPPSPDALAELRFATGRTVQCVLATEREVLAEIETHYGVTVQRLVGNLSTEAGGDEDSEQYFIHDLREKASEPTVVNLINLVFAEAISAGASDIHVEPFEQEMKIKYRVDGTLHEIAPPPRHLQPAIVSRIKIMAGMDIAKRHVPQDGHIRINTAKAAVDVRVATVPTVFGESVVMRLLNKDGMRYSLDEIGLPGDVYRRFGLLLARTHGLVLVCGPTGCGKTTTLYAALSRIYTPEKKIITIEDPVEYQLAGINQIPVRNTRGVTFAAGLRAILRQDPDILMVGEIRDIETAEIAIRSALTGHLIFSTLHTNDAASAITRMLDMGLEPYLIASSLQGALAQRLVRQLCTRCRVPMQPDAPTLAQFDKTPDDARGHTFYAAVGCEHCHGRGYSGRTGVYELLLMSEEMQHMILNCQSSHLIKNAAMQGVTAMRDDGWQKICAGITSFDEVLRQTQRDRIEDASPGAGA